MAAWAHVVDIQASQPHYHQKGTELYYVLDGGGTIWLDGEAHQVRHGEDQLAVDDSPVDEP